MLKLKKNEKLTIKLNSKDALEDDTTFLPFFDRSFVVRMVLMLLGKSSLIRYFIDAIS